MLRTPNVSQFPAAARTARVAWTVVSIFIVERLVFGLSGLPAFLFWTWALSWATPPWPLVRPVILAMSLVPAYLSFAITLILLSAGTTRLFGWRTAPDGAWRLADLEWPLLDWSRYMISTHVVRVLVGTFFRSSPLWTWYMKLNGARIGARRLHQQPVDFRSQHAGVRRRRRDWRERASVGAHRRRRRGEDRTRAPRTRRDGRPRQHGRHRRRGGRALPDRRAERRAEEHQARRRRDLRRRAGAAHREVRRRARSRSAESSA